MARLNKLLLLHALACLALLLPCGAHARHILDLDVNTQPAQLKDWGDYAIDPTGAATLPEMLMQPQRFQPTLPDSSYPLEPGQSLWIRFTVPAAPDEQRWYVRIALPGLDSATLYTRGGNNDVWSAQRSGDKYRVSTWALPHVEPVLPLAVSAADPSYYMLRIEASDGMGVPIEFVSESWLSWEQQRLSLLYGVYFGLLAMGAIFALASSAVLRDLTYFWFGLWTVLAMLATATAAGVAGLHVWPEFPQWSDAAHHVLPAATTVPFILFIVQVLAVRERAERLFWPCVLLALSAGGFAVLCAIAPSPARRWISQGTITAMALVAIVIAIWSWDHGERLARRLLLALLPFAITLALYAARRSAGEWVAGHALVLLLAGLAISICATYLLLGSRNQVRRDSHRRITQLQEIDPLTGLVNDAVFANRLAELISRAEKFGHQSAVAIVDCANFPQLRSEFGRKHSVEMLLRLAERLNAMMRTVDTVARLGESRFGLQVDGPVATSRARALCAKVIAHCITPMAGLPVGMVLKPRVAMALVPSHGTQGPAVIAQLEQMLREAAADPARVILIAETAEQPVAPQPAPAADSGPATSSRISALDDTEFQPTSASDEVD